MPLKRIWIPSPNYSTRSSAVRIIVLHTAEGARTYRSLGSFFSSSSSGVSSQVGIDDTVNTVGEYVKPDKKPWTQGQFNSTAVSAELCAFAAWDAAEWARHPNMLANTAAWIAEEAERFNIPIVKLTPSQAQGSGRGVCQHVDLGSAGGGHTDCGKAFPIDKVIEMAKAGGSPVRPTPPPFSPWEDEVFIKQKDGRVDQLIYGGASSYWRLIPADMVRDIPAGMIIDDPNGEWLKLWKQGAA